MLKIKEKKNSSNIGLAKWGLTASIIFYLLLNISNSNRLLWVKFPHFAKQMSYRQYGSL